MSERQLSGPDETAGQSGPSPEDYDRWMADAQEPDPGPAEHDPDHLPVPPADALPPANVRSIDEHEPQNQDQLEAATTALRDDRDTMRQTAEINWINYLTAEGQRKIIAAAFEKQSQDLAEKAEALGQARLDALTGIPNQLGLDARLESLWGVKDSDPDYRPEERRRHMNAPRYAIIVKLDLAELKIYNDIRHGLGDEAVRRMGLRLSSMARGTDMVAREVTDKSETDTSAEAGGTAAIDKTLASQEAREAGDDFLVVIPLPNELDEDMRQAVLAAVLERYRDEFSRPTTFGEDGVTPDPVKRIEEAKAIWLKYESQVAAWDDDPRPTDEKGPRPRAADLPIHPLASVGAAMGRIVPAEEEFAPNEPNRNYHRLRAEAGENEQKHAALMREQNITNPRPTAVVPAERPSGGE